MTTKNTKTNMQECIHDAIDEYFEHLEGQPPQNLYELFQHEVEKSLFECVLKHTKGNQSRASEYLGINRGTLRKKLKLYELNK